MMHDRFSRRFRTAAWLAACAAALALPLAGCGTDRADSANQMTSYSSAVSRSERAELFTVPAEQMSHVQVVTVEPAKLVRTLRLTGSVTYNAFRTTPVITQVSGPVNRIVVAPGEHVSAGQPMLYVRSPDYSQLRASFLKARDAFELADKNFQRAQDLYAHHAIAERDLLQAQSDRNQAQADLQANEAALRILGVTDPDNLAKNPPSPEVPVLAPIGGEVVERLVSPGQVIQAGATQCFTLSDMSTVWVLANVYQNDLAYVRVGDPVTIEQDAYPSMVFHGRISYIAAALDPNTRTLQARMVTNNPGERLKKDMYVTAMVQAGVIPDALAVPDAAVLRDTENHPFVYVAAGPNQFARRLVTIGETRDGRTQITSGLKPGERVVGDGSLFLQFMNSLQR